MTLKPTGGDIGLLIAGAVIPGAVTVSAFRPQRQESELVRLS